MAGRALRVGLCFALSLAISPSVWARGQLQAGPTLVELAPGTVAGRLILSNTGDAPVAAQVRAYVWSQVDGDDRLSPASDLALSPAIVKIAPGASQIVRVVRQGPPPTGKDLTYRVVVDQLPLPEDEESSGLNLRMRYVVPVYARSAKASAPQLACSLSGQHLVCDNAGGQAAQFGASRLIDGHGKVAVLSPGLLGYVLPGARRQWQLQAQSLSNLTAELRLETQLNGQAAAVPVSRGP